MDTLLAYIQGLKTGQGWNKGQPFTVFPWERRFVRGVFGQAFRQGDAALTVARGAGKSTLISTIGAATLDGPLIAEQAETAIVAPSLTQARITFNHVKRFMGAALDDKRTWRVWDNAQVSMIEHKKTGQMLRCLGADPRRLHGLAPALIIVDEPAQFPPNSAEEVHGVLRTAMGKIPGSRMIALGTRPLEGNEHFFNDMLRDADYIQAHACVKDKDPLWHKASWAKACPSLRHGMPDLLAEIRAEADRARKNPALLPGFKALRLNLGTAPIGYSAVMDPDTWRAAEGEAAREGPHILGLDLSDGTAMCGQAAFWPLTGRLEVLAMFPAVPSLAERGLSDGCGKLYVRCQERGEVFTCPGRAVDVPAFLRRGLQEWGRPVAVLADRYRERDLCEALEAARFPLADLEIRGQGYKDGAEDLRAFRRAFAVDRVTPAVSLLMRSALAEARTVSDPAGNEKLAKATQNGRRLRLRDDVVAAAILAVAGGVRRFPEAAPDTPRKLYHGTVG